MKIKSLPLIIVVFLTFFSVTLNGQTFEKKEAVKKVAGSKLVKLDETSKSIKFIQLRDDYLYSSKSKATWLNKSLKFTKNHNANILNEEVDKNGSTHTKYQISFKDIPVEGSVYIVHSKNGRIESANGNYLQGQNISVTPSLSEREAFDKAVKYVHAKKYLWESDNSQMPTGKLTILTVDTTYLLTYKFDIYAIEPLSRQYVFVNANSGAVVKTLNRIHFINSDGIAKTMYNGTVSIKTDLNKGSYRLRETGRGNGIETYNLHHGVDYTKATDFIDTDNNWTDTIDYDQAATDAHFAAEATYDYYYLKFGRNSFDNKGSKIMSYVHYKHNFNNAFWDGTCMTYGDGDGIDYLPFTPIEIVAHEITHGVTEHSADLIYSEESGALNESFSDIFGTAIDFYKNPKTANYLMGDAMSPTHTAFRSMQNPNDYGDPDTYKGLFWDPDQEVHNNSGVQNYWFYLLCEGGTGTNDLGNTFSVQAIGMENAAQIAYRNLTVYLTPSSTYADARFYSIQSAIDLFGECSPEVMAVTNAWYAVGVGDQYSNSVIADFMTSKMNACDIPAQIRFYNKSANASSYLWDFGDGGTDTTSNPIHTFKNTGNYLVRLISNGRASCSNTDTTKKTITISKVQSPISSSCSPRTLNPGTGGIYSFQFNTINKTSNGSGDNYQDYTCTDTTTIAEGRKYKIAVKVGIDNPENVYVWLDLNNNGKFEDAGELIYQKNKVSKYCTDSLIIPAGAIYNIPLRLRVGTDYATYPLTDACTDSKYGQFQDYTLYVRQNTSLPSVNFSSNRKNIIGGDTIQFKDNTLNLPTSWTWSFPGGSPSTSTLPNPKVVYNTSGNYDVTLTASNSKGTNSITKKGYITVTTPAPLGLSAIIKNQTTGEVDLKWSSINDINVYEDFEDGIADNFTYSDTCFTVENGYLKASGIADNKWKKARLEKDFQDFLLEYKFQQVQGDPNYSMGSFIRANGSLNGKDANGYLINVLPDGAYSMWKVIDGNYINLIPWKTTTAINTTEGAWNIVTINAVGNIIKLYINGQYVDEFSDDTFASGKIDLGSYFGQPYNYDVRWDYMNVITTGTSLTSLNLPKATNAIIAGADDRNFTEHPLVSLRNNIVEPKGIISQLKSIRSADVLSYYKIYRDSLLIKTTNNTAYTDTLPKNGIYKYFVTAKFDDKESNPTNKVTVNWGQSKPLPGENCSNAQDLAALTSPYAGSTIGYKQDFNFCNMGSAPDRIFYIKVPGNYSLEIGPQQTDFDMVYSIRVGGNCPGDTEIVCGDEPNDQIYTYKNTTDSEQNLYFIISGYYGDSGNFNLFWKFSPIAKPVASFTANTTMISPGSSVIFSNSTKEFSTSWKWSFDGGNPSTSKLQNPTVAYDSIGNYDVKLIVSNSLGTDSIIKTSYINVTNQAYCTSGLGGNGECPGDITAVSIKGTTLNNINHSNCTTSSNSTYGLYPTIGNTTATIKADTTYQLSVTTSYADKISVWIDYDKNGSFETSEWTQVATSSVPDKPSTVSVKIPPTALSGETRMRIRSNFYLGTNGAEDACSNFNSGITEDYTVLITNVPKSPIADFTVKQTLVVDENVVFSDFSIGSPTSWRWSFPGGEPSSSTLQNPVVRYGKAGTYDVKLVVTNSLGTDSIVKTGFIAVTLPKKPVADFIANLTSIVTGSQVSFFDNSTNKPTSRKWTFDGGTPSTSTTNNASTTYNIAGTYNVKLVVSNAGGADSIIKTGYITVTIPQKPVVNFYTNTTNAIAGSNVCFHDSCLNNPTSWQWTFDGGTPSTSTEKNPCIKYTIPGTYDVTLTATNALGTDSQIKKGYMTILTAPKPNASFTVNTRNGVTGSYIYFRDISSNFPTSWKWTFTGGTPSISTSSYDSVIYKNPGTYDVKLVASNASGSDSVISKGYIAISIPTKPIADFMTYSRNTEAGSSISFHDKSLNNPTAWKWTFDGGTPSTSTEKNPSVTYNTIGSYDVKLIVTNSAGSDTIIRKKYSVVLPLTVPVIDFTVDTRNPEVNSDITFTIITNSSISYLRWTFEGGTPSTSSAYNPIIRYSKSGIYDVKFVAGNAVGRDSIVKKQYITVIPPPAPIASFYANKTTVLKTSTVAFICNSGNSTSWKWTFPGGKPSTSKERNPSIVYNTLGSFDVKLVVLNETGSDSITQTGYINVVSQLKPEANFFVAKTSVQLGSKVSFLNTSLNNPTSFKWEFEGGTPSISTSKNPFITYNTPGVYDVKLIASNDAGSDSITKAGQISVINPDFKANNAVACQNESIQFTDLTNGNPNSWNWLFPGGIPASSNLKSPTVVYREAGAKTISLTINGTFKVTKTNFLVVTKKPIAHIDLIDNKLVSDNQMGNQWYSLSDGIIKEATAQTFIPTKNDNYFLIVTIDGCSSGNSDTLNYIVTDSKNLSLDEQLNIYPLPVKQFLNIESSSEIESIEVFGIAGNVIIKQVNIKSKNHILNMSPCSPGTYILKVFLPRTPEIPVVRKIIKSN